MKRAPGRIAFTLVELLVVITIIGILISLLLPAVQAAREAARRLQCANNMKQIGLALHNYLAAYDVFPMGESVTMARPPGVSVPYTGYSWATVILPYLEQQTLWDSLDQSYPGYMYPTVQGPAQHQAALCTVVGTYLCPSSGHARTYSYDAVRVPNNLGYSPNDYGMLEYVGIAGSDRYGSPYPFPSKAGTLYNRSSIAAAEIRDGLSNTMVVGEYSGLAPGQGYSSAGGLGDNDTTWGIGFEGGSPNQGLEAGTWAVRTISYPPNTAWYYPAAGCDPPIANRVTRAALKSSHPGGIHVVMGDASIQFLSNGIDLTVYQDLADRDDGHPAVPF